jgi:hypothetical protein
MPWPSAQSFCYFKSRRPIPPGFQGISGDIGYKKKAGTPAIAWVSGLLDASVDAVLVEMAGTSPSHPLSP